ncbi:ElyC/SanA/YdcF family protein [Hyphomonas johnsonii]|uniref:DUF218 domain-containing protein n=1 Tax=Hyphomonas johnsonii MHS-2 TaxID=1280950 RepID=A0A059F9R7_9PROT|nr:ElyC/SanA/YdcF family protein [Hyphomonas johnsonii]KCZ87345.1 hypothetical protein HJO_16902 [Hyphomonas johnsonii MHS-2]
MKRARILLVRLLVADLVATLVFFGLTRFQDQTSSIEGGAGIVFYSDSAEEADSRIDKGIALLEAGKVDRLFMVGGHRPQEGIVGSQDMALAAIRRSGQGARISADVTSRDTISGLRSLHEQRALADASQLVFISNCMHLLRAKTIYHSLSHGGPRARSACARVSRNPVDIWKRAHYEAGAWVVYILPESWRNTVLDRLRGGPQGDSAP